ncbi:MAG: DUF998 domain-containing protein [Parvularculaceae bacterium]|nr:DUF998 domain-containing protein [Parvularculaceae bacterium]
MKLFPGIVGVLLIATGIGVPTVLGANTPGYDPRTNFLSELGATGAPSADLMNFGAFLPTGVLWAVAAALIWRRLPQGALGTAGALLLFGGAISYVGSAVYPCDAGCPGSGSFSQTMHNLTGAIGYFLTPPALALIGLQCRSAGRAVFGAATLVCAAIAAVGFGLMLQDLGANNAGLWQRFADFTPILWMASALVVAPRAR